MTIESAKSESKRRQEYDASDLLGDRPRKKYSAIETMGAILLAGIVASLFNSAALARLAARQGPGASFGDNAVSVADANLSVAGLVRLDRVPELFDRLISGPDGSVAPPPLPPPSTTTTSVVVIETTTSTTAPPVQLAVKHPVTANDPLSMYIGGDSIGKDLAEALARVTPVQLVEPELGAKVSTGLTQPDFFDWPGEIGTVADRDSVPDVIIFLVGSNDWQDKFEIDDRGSEAWANYYRSQVAILMDSVSSAGSDGGAIHMIWVTLPPIRSDKMSSRGVDLMNSIYVSEAENRTWVEVVDAYEMFGGVAGFSESIGGEKVRQADGIHLNFAGINLLAEEVFERVKNEWDFPLGT